jgi:nicotinamide phosphoribosyltransferase
MKNQPVMLLADAYKLHHRVQYPEGTECVFSTWTPRQSLVEGVNQVVSAGQQKVIKEYLIDYFNENFFAQDKERIVADYVRVMKHAFFDPNPETKHIEDLHALGYLPLSIKSLPEGTLVPIRVPMMTIENTDPRFFWLTNFLETLISAELWATSTSATLAHQYKKILTKAAKETGGDLGFITFQAHDFSMRGMSSVPSSINSGLGHLMSFAGTDTIPAIMAAETYYNADITKELVGTSVFATEHSIMCASGQNEYDTFMRLLTKVHPKGILSVVSDTWDFWNVVGNILPKLKDTIMARDGKLVIRPDSGDPVKIVCGDRESNDILVNKGLIECLWDTFGGTVNAAGYKELDPHIGAIYGDSITLKRAQQIVDGLKAKGFASTNIVFGVGSFTYQYNTRDTFGFAMKATSVKINGEEVAIFKKPKTDNGTKTSAKGRVVVYKNSAGDLEYIDGFNRKNADLQTDNLLVEIFRDGELLNETSLAEIRERLNAKV